MMIKIMLGEKSTDITPQNWPQIRDAVDRLYSSMTALEMIISASPTDSAVAAESQDQSQSESYTRFPPILAETKRAIAGASIKGWTRATEVKKIVDYAVQALGQLGKWSTVDQIAECMEENGWNTTSKNIRSRNETVRNTMRNYKDLLQNQGSLWGLVEWPMIPIDPDKLPSYIFDEDDENVITINELFEDDDDKQRNGITNELGPNFGRIP